jgi:hypothetical protein
MLGARIGLPIVDQIVSLNGAELHDDNMLLAGDLGMSDMSAVDVSARLLGGNVDLIYFHVFSIDSLDCISRIVFE